jgi:DNA-binding transcriptional regulator GbsR (MarR family)
VAIARDSEQKRVELQEFIKQTAVKIEHQARENKQYQDSLNHTNSELQDEILRLREQLNQSNIEKL